MMKLSDMVILRRILMKQACKYTRTQQDAEDLVHDVMLAGCERPEFTSSQWHIVAMRNRSMNITRNAKRRARKRLLNPDMFAPYQRDVGKEDMLSVIDIAVESLPPTERTVIRAHYYDGVRVPDVAVYLGISHTSAYTRLKMGVQSIEEQYSPRLTIYLTFQLGILKCVFLGILIDARP